MENCKLRVEALRTFLRTESFNPWGEKKATALPLTCAMVGGTPYLLTFEPGCHADDGSISRVCEGLDKNKCATVDGCHFLEGKENCDPGSVRIMCVPDDKSYNNLHCDVWHYPGGFASPGCGQTSSREHHTCERFQVSYDKLQDSYRFVENSHEKCAP